MRNYFLILLVSLQFSIYLLAQETVQPDRNLVYKGQKSSPADTTSLFYAFKKGQFNGRIRYFFMSTRNEGDLTDYYAHAVGGGLRFESAKFYNFQLAVSGFVVFNIGSSDLTSPDNLTDLSSRYEIGNFDVSHPGNKKWIGRSEELYLKYNYKHSFIKAGRQYINSTFINLQDGRMSPTAVSGIWTEINEINRLKIQAGWLWGILPRSTTSWYKPGQSIGVFMVGVNPDGIKSGYSGNVESNGIGIAQVTAQLKKELKLQFSNMYVANVFNSSLLQMDYQYTIKNNSTLFAGLQVVKQYAINNGGNVNQSKTYFQKGSGSFTFGTRAGWKNVKWEAMLNYNRITTRGRYLVPREWGIEPFFTFLPRERNDGFGNADAVMVRLTYSAPKARLKTSIAAGCYYLPDVKEYHLNKYGMPSYAQVNADLKYSFTNIFKGLEAQVLIVDKFNMGETYHNYKYTFNKVEMLQYNFIVNYHF